MCVTVSLSLVCHARSSKDNSALLAVVSLGSGNPANRHGLVGC